MGPDFTGHGFLIGTAHLLLAAAVTAHVLLHKRDVRAALGWIGLAWLSPVVGVILYFLFGINRVTRRAIRFGGLRREREREREAGDDARPDVPEPIALLALVGRRVTGTDLAAGNRADLFEGGDEAYPAMLAAIEAARHSIALESYIFRGDEAGLKLADALIAAHRRTVAVRVLIDGVGGGYLFSPIAHHLREAGVPVGRFLHSRVPWRMPFLNMRSHKKLLIVDGCVAFAGGLNIGAENCSRDGNPAPVDDVHARIEGPVVAQLMDVFGRDWFFAAGESLKDALWWPPLMPAGSVFARTIRSGPDADVYSLETILGAALTQARRRVRIVTPYFLPSQRLESAIGQAVLRGVAVEIILPHQGNHPLLDWAMRAQLRFFHEMPPVVFFSPAPFDHAKLATVDGEWCLIGSSNWDTRSLRLNFELDVEFYDRALTAQIDARIDKRIALSHRVSRADLLRAPRWRKIRDAAIRLMSPYL